MRFGVLGPLCVRAGEVEVSVPAHRDRVVLAILLLNANQVVPPDDLVDALWAGGPPSTARAQVHGCVSRLRRLLNDRTLCTEPAGYLLRVGVDELDAWMFDGLIARAHAAVRGGDPLAASASFRTALALWRGAAYAGVESAMVRAVAARFDEQRWLAWEECLDVELSLGRAAELVGELTELVGTHPLRERLRGQLMLALYRSGRQGEALAGFLSARRELAAELGVEPGADLAELHRRMLRRDRALDLPIESTGSIGSMGSIGSVDATEPVGSVGLIGSAGSVGSVGSVGDLGPAAAPRGLPRDIGDFTGRSAVVNALLAGLPAQPDAHSVVCAIDGMPGTGKTSLAVHVAHRVADGYPDGQFAIDLHGHSELAPAEPAAALDTLLRQLGVPGEQIPDRLESRVALWRSVLSGRRVLLLLDNAATSAQVTPLLPGGSGCLTLITSRRRLAGLDGVHPVSLEVLPAGEAVALLHRIVGARVLAEPAAAAEVAHQCGYLALAIRLAAARLVHRPGWSVSDLVARLGAARPALHEIAAEGRTLSAAFALSYDHIGGPDRLVFRRLGLHPGTEFDARVAAALADLPVAQTSAVLDRLVDAHLVQEPTAGRYRLHDLLREYARGLVEATETAAQRTTAITRMLDFYLYSAAVLDLPLELHPYEYRLAQPPPEQAITSGTECEALAWFTIERENVIAAIGLAAERGLTRYTWQLTRALWRFLFITCHNDDLLGTHRLAVAGLRAGADDEAIAITRNYLASGYLRVGRYRDALAELQVAQEYMQRSGNESDVANVQYNIGLVLERLCRFTQALDFLRRSAATRERLGDRLGGAAAQGMIGVLLVDLGRYEEALDFHQRAGQLLAEFPSDYMIAIVAGHQGAALLRLGRLAEAEPYLRRAIELKPTTNNEIGAAETLGDLALLHRLRGDLPAALRCHRRALAMVHSGGDRFVECVLRNGYGVTLGAAGDPVAAAQQHSAALALAEEIETPLERGRALAGLAELDWPAEPQIAVDRWRQALRIFTELGVPDRHAVAQRLAAVQ